MSESGRDPFSQLLYPMLSAQPAAGDVARPGTGARATREVGGEQPPPPASCSRSSATRSSARRRDGGGLPQWWAAPRARQRRQRHVGCGHRHRAARSLGERLCRFPALCLTNDIAVVTGIGNDVGFNDVFVRQIIALGRAGDVVLAVSASGNSENLVRGLGEARRRDMPTIAICGYDGGRLAREQVSDHCFVVRSSSVHRIQEVQMTLYHLLTDAGAPRT